MSSLRNAYHRVALSQFNFLQRNLTTNGLLTGNENANVNGSVTPVKFYTQPPTGIFYNIVAGVFAVSDGGSTSINDYGAIDGPLANGVQVFIEKDGVETLIGNPIKSNRGLHDIGPNIQTTAFSAVDLRVYNFDIFNYYPRGIQLNGNTNDKFGVIIQDDISTLNTHTVGVKGSQSFIVVP